MYHSLSISSVCKTSEARRQEWVAFPFSRWSSQPRDWTQVSRTAGGFFTSWATREAQECWSGQPIPSPASPQHHCSCLLPGVPACSLTPHSPVKHRGHRDLLKTWIQSPLPHTSLSPLPTPPRTWTHPDKWHIISDLYLHTYNIEWNNFISENQF